MSKDVSSEDEDEKLTSPEIKRIDAKIMKLKGLADLKIRQNRAKVLAKPTKYEIENMMQKI